MQIGYCIAAMGLKIKAEFTECLNIVVTRGLSNPLEFDDSSTQFFQIKAQIWYVQFDIVNKPADTPGDRQADTPCPALAEIDDASKTDELTLVREKRTFVHVITGKSSPFLQSITLAGVHI